MKLKFKSILIAALLVLLLIGFTGCAQEETPYQINDADGYTVSVRYDANGGIFTTNTSVIVDSYSLSDLKKGSDGMAEIALLSPDNAVRGNDAFTAINNGYFLAGWYTQRHESKDSQGNSVYSYEGKWDFETDTISVDPGRTYSSAEPVVTLYAAWIPLFKIDFYSLDSGEYLDSYTFNPELVNEIPVPALDTQTGTVEMHNFPKRSGYTFDAAFYDKDAARSVDSAALVHPGSVDYTTGTAQNASMNVYIQWTEGEWFHIYNVEQFLDLASVSGNYVIHADLDFTDEIWPSSLMYGNFSGTIEGNGHTFRNISLEQTNNSKTNAGLFGNLTENAVIKDLSLENVSFTIKSGARMAGTGYGLLAGTVSSSAVLENLSIANSVLRIDSGCYFGTDDYSIGLVCGMGTAQVDYSGISWEAVGASPESVVITVNGSDVSVEFVIG